MTRWIAADMIFDGQTLMPGHAICITAGRVTDLQPIDSVHRADICTQYRGLITPGFFDIQVNGGGGVLLNATPTRDGIAAILAAHRAHGTTALLPTVITDTHEVLDAAAEACLAARDLPGMCGIHIEGPHISQARRGTHAPQNIRAMSDRTLDVVHKLRAADLPVLITVAPEATTSAQITALRAMGAIVSIGHSDASAQDAAQAVAAGATCFTHLFNAMSPMLNRTPGVTGAAIASDVYCSIIADGIHVDPLMVALAIRARPVSDRMIAVSDAMATVGGPDAFNLYGQEIHLQDGRLVNAEGSLAGAHLTMGVALQNLVTYGVALETALRMCITNPAALMGFAAPSLIGYTQNDLVLMSPDLDLHAVGVTKPVPASLGV